MFPPGLARVLDRLSPALHRFLGAAACAAWLGAFPEPGSAQSLEPIERSATLAALHPPTAFYAETTRISFDFNEMPLRDALLAVASLSGLHLVFAEDLLPMDRHVTARGEEVTPQEAFSRILSGYRLQVVISSSRFAAVVRSRVPSDFGAISPEPVDLVVRAEPPPISLEPQISGVVLGADGAPLRGAYVRLCGTRQVELTDATGRFVLRGIDGPVRLSVSHVGYSERVSRLEPHRGAGPVPGLIQLNEGTRTARAGECPEP